MTNDSLVANYLSYSLLPQITRILFSALLTPILLKLGTSWDQLKNQFFSQYYCDIINSQDDFLSLDLVLYIKSSLTSTLLSQAPQCVDRRVQGESENTMYRVIFLLAVYLLYLHTYTDIFTAPSCFQKSVILGQKKDKNTM